MAKSAATKLIEASIRSHRKQIATLERAQRDMERDGAAPLAIGGLTNQISALGRASAALAAEYRKQCESDAAQAEALTPEQRAEMTIETLGDWPIELRQRLAQALADLGQGL